MADKQLKVHGVPQPKGLAFLNEVRVDAARNAVENLRQQQEKKEFEAAKARGITPQEIISKGKVDLGVAEEDTETVEQPQHTASKQEKKGDK